MVKQSPASEDIAALRRDLVKLNAKVDALQSTMKDKKSTDKKDSRKKFNWRRLVIGTSAVLATLLLVLGNIFFSAGRAIIIQIATLQPLT